MSALATSCVVCVGELPCCNGMRVKNPESGEKCGEGSSCAAPTGDPLRCSGETVVQHDQTTRCESGGTGSQYCTETSSPYTCTESFLCDIKPVEQADGTIVKECGPDVAVTNQNGDPVVSIAYPAGYDTCRECGKG